MRILLGILIHALKTLVVVGVLLFLFAATYGISSYIGYDFLDHFVPWLLVYIGEVLLCAFAFRFHKAKIQPVFGSNVVWQAIFIVAAFLVIIFLTVFFWLSQSTLGYWS